MKADTFGKACEIMAVNYLKDIGYKILATNYKNKIGEIDIIARDKDTTVFVEVKGRLTRRFGDPLEAIDEYKIMKIRQTATVYLMKNKLLNTLVRFDAISILGDKDSEIRHIKDAF